MTQKKAEILLAAVIAARATSLLFSKIAMNGMGIFNLLAARFLMAFVLLAVVFFKRLRHIKRHTLVRGAIMGALFFLTVVCSGLSIYAGFCLLWGVNYYADSFQQQSGIYARSCTVEELEAVTADFARQLAQAADNVQRDENGCFAVSRQEIFAAATSVYAPSYEEFPCLRVKDHTPKAISCSTVLSAMDFTGFYFPFTGEANLNVDCPASFLPSTIVHEMAHQRGIASEQECNFIAIAVSLASGDPVYRYSGLLMGYVHLGNALYRADPDRWQVIRDTLPDTVVADLRQNSAYWAAFEGPVNDAASKVYDSFLKSNGESRGVQSYGTVVDMLMAYYG